MQEVNLDCAFTVFGPVDYNLNFFKNREHKPILTDIAIDTLVPKLGLGTHLPAKLSLATIFVPKCNLGTS
jgi:hypothetical protein